MDATSVYWTDFERGTVMKVPTGGGTITTLASGLAAPGASPWTPPASTGRAQGSAVMKVPTGGGTPTTLASGHSSASGIAVDATSVYWTNRAGTVMTTPK